MVGLIRRTRPLPMPVEVEPVDVFGPIDRAFERMFGFWDALAPFRPTMLTPLAGEKFIPVEEFDEDGSLVIRAELPGIDPDKDVDLTVSDGMLLIKAERRESERTEDKGYVRREMRYGSFARTLPLPDGADESDVSASYKDGILEVRVPVATPEPGKKIPIGKG